MVSTRRPVRGLRAHAWSEEAEGRTMYLFPPGWDGVVRMTKGFMRAGPGGWWRVGRVVMKGEKRLRLVGLAGTACGLLQRARELGWEHVHAHSAGDCAVVAMLCERLGGPGYSVTLHGPLKDYGLNQGLKWGHADFGVVITQTLLGEMREKLGDSVPGRMYVAPMGVEVERFERAEPYRAWQGGVVRLFCCGRLNRVKGHGELARAVRRLKERGWEVELTIAGQDDKGGGGYRRELEGLIRELGIEGNVRLLGAVDEGEVARGLHGSHVFVLGSWHEPLGVAIMEAMAAGVPVVVTRGGGVTELVREGEGVLVEPRSVEGLVEGIERVLRDPELACRLAEAGYRRVREGFHSRVSAEAVIRGIREGEATRRRMGSGVDERVSLAGSLGRDARNAGGVR